MNRNIIKRFSALAKEADEKGMLLPEQLKIIYDQKWFKLFVPKAYGGLGLTLVEGLEIEEALAKIDGSLGWTVTLCTGATQFIGYLPIALSASIFKDKKVCFAGSGAIGGVAIEEADGYVINGKWKYATGAPYATHFTANCQLLKNGKLLTYDDSSPVYASFIFTRDEVTVYDDWNAMGLRATASQSFSVTDLTANKERAFIIDANHTILTDTIYKFPFLQFAETTLAVNTLGMAQHFLQELDILIKNNKVLGRMAKEQTAVMQQRWNLAYIHLQRLRERFYNSIQQAWNMLQEQKEIPPYYLNQITQLSRGLTKSSREMVGDLYPYCGVGATQNGTLLNRIFKDIFTASQHLLLNL